MSDRLSNKPPVVASVERSKSIYNDQQRRQTEEHSCWSLRIDWRILPLLSFLCFVMVLQLPELLPKILKWVGMLSKHF